MASSGPLGTPLRAGLKSRGRPGGREGWKRGRGRRGGWGDTERKAAQDLSLIMSYHAISYRSIAYNIISCSRMQYGITQ